MDWRDEGILLSARRHGESAAIVEILTAAHGRHAGVVRGGGSRRMAATLQPGTRLAVAWSARLEEHIGSFRVDTVAALPASVMADGAALAALSALTALVAATLPERDSHPELYTRTRDLVAALGDVPDWPARYAAWEIALLAELGFGLDLAACAVTGSTQDLAWVSPRTGRAVSRSAGAPWADRLLPLPAFLRLDGAAATAADVAAALSLAGHFLDARVAPGLPRGTLPPARARAVAAILRYRRNPSQE